VEGKYKMKDKMLTTEDTKVTENDNRQMIRSVKGRGRLAPGPRSASGRGGDFLILVQFSPMRYCRVTSRRFNVVDRGLQTHARCACLLGVHRELVVVGWRAGGWTGRGERGMGCGTHFLNRAAFQRGKQAENKLKTAIFGRGTTRKNRLNCPTFGPFGPRITRKQKGKSQK
jgi:hypothetical protein